jgi:hypothetical protein
METKVLVAALGLMSMIVALEATWLAKRIKSDKYLAWLTSKSAEAVLRTIYFIGLPYLALISGLLPARLFGLKGLEFLTVPNFSQAWSEIFNSLLIQIGQILLTWLPDFGLMASLSTLLGGIFFFYFWLYLQAIKPQNLESISPGYYSKVDLLFDVVHWSFYRAVGWLIFDDLYLGVIGGLIMVLLEYVTASRLGKFSCVGQQQYLLRFGWGLITSVTFLFVPNVWFTFAFQFILVAGSEGLLKYRRLSVLRVS